MTCEGSYTRIDRCRICGSRELIPVLHLGEQALTSVFPKSKDEEVPSIPLELIKCTGGSAACGLLQLRHTTDKRLIYKPGYGYKSSLNRSMVKHLQTIVAKALRYTTLSHNDIVLDIASNDNTLLRQYPQGDFTRCGIDPLANTLAEASDIYPIHDYFSKEAYCNVFDQRKAKIVTAIAVLYDLDCPLDMFYDVQDILDEHGVWIIEQSYMPAMLSEGIYDLVCHEHLEYYGIAEIKWMADKTGFKIIDFTFTEVNGGSLMVVLAKKESHFSEINDRVSECLEKEKNLYQNEERALKEYEKKVISHKKKVHTTMEFLKNDGHRIIGYGASTKGNVLLQFCDIDQTMVESILEVNSEKYGAYTPGTRIPIVAEKTFERTDSDVLLVLPWHFKREIVGKEQDFLKKGGKCVFPFPQVEVISY